MIITRLRTSGRQASNGFVGSGPWWAVSLRDYYYYYYYYILMRPRKVRTVFFQFSWSWILGKEVISVIIESIILYLIFNETTEHSSNVNFNSNKKNYLEIKPTEEKNDLDTILYHLLSLLHISLSLSLIENDNINLLWIR